MHFQLTPGQVQLRERVREVARHELKPLAARRDRTHESLWESIKHLARVGVLGLTIPEAYGGLGGTPQIQRNIIADALVGREE